MPNVNTDILRVGADYTSKELAELWGYQDYHALAKGIVTPSGLKKILLFVTHKKEADRVQYVDKLEGNMLYMEGQLKHGTDKRIADNLHFRNDEFFLFYRDNKFQPYTYLGNCILVEADLHQDQPSNFTFVIKQD